MRSPAGLNDVSSATVVSEQWGETKVWGWLLLRPLRRYVAVLSGVMRGNLDGSMSPNHNSSGKPAMTGSAYQLCKT